VQQKEMPSMDKSLKYFSCARKEPIYPSFSLYKEVVEITGKFCHLGLNSQELKEFPPKKK